jgi:hypothetical protein
MVEAAWKVVAPIQNVWGALEPRDFPNYPAGAWGPEAAAELLAKDGRHWYEGPPVRDRADGQRGLAAGEQASPGQKA